MSNTQLIFSEPLKLETLMKLKGKPLYTYYQIGDRVAYFFEELESDIPGFIDYKIRCVTERTLDKFNEEYEFVKKINEKDFLYRKKKMIIQKEYISQEKIDCYINELYNKINKNNYDIVIGIEKGGLNISIPLAKKMNVKHESIKISYYNDKDELQENPIIDINHNIFKENKNILIIDDLVDSGSTLKKIKEILKQYDCKFSFGVLYITKRFENEIDYWCEYKPDCWLVFPWEI